MLAILRRGRVMLAGLVLLAAQAQAQVGLATFTSTHGFSGYIAILDISSGLFTPVVTPLDWGSRPAC